MRTYNLPSATSPISLRKLRDFLDRTPALHHVAQGLYLENELDEVSTWLAAYAANKKEILSTIINELNNPSAFQRLNDFQAPSFIIYQQQHYTLRLVMWLPVQGSFDRAPYSYGEAHDHNFDFWTVNFFGSGYRTRLYSYDYATISGINGETVALNFHGERGLTPGITMFYYRSRDVHIQYPPRDLSVSLNLIVQPSTPLHQYEFNLDPQAMSHNISATIKTGRFERYIFQKTLLNGLLSLGSSESLRRILKISHGSNPEEIRVIAWHALINYALNHRDQQFINFLATQASADPSLYVRKSIANRIGNMPLA